MLPMILNFVGSPMNLGVLVEPRSRSGWEEKERRLPPSMNNLDFDSSILSIVLT